MKKSDIVKAWLGSAIQDFVSILKTGGWKVAALGVPVAAAGLTLTACQVEKIEVQVAQIDTLDQIQTLFGDSFSVAEQVEDAAKEKFGNNLVSLMSENANGAGKVVAFFKEDGQLKKATATLNLDAADFDAKIYGYNTFTKQGETLSFWQNGQEQEVDLSAPGVLYVIQGDGTLTVMNTTAVQNEIENAVDSMQIENLGLQTDLDEVGKEDLKTMLGFVIEQAGTAHLPTLTLEYDRVSNQTTATYSYLSLAGQTKIESGNIVFEGNLIENDSLNRTAAEEQLQTERAVIRANRASVLEEATYTTLFELDDFDLNSVDLEVAEKNSGGDESQIEISNENYESFDKFFADLSGENLEEFENAISETLRNGFTEQDLVTIFGRGTSLANTSTLKIAFDFAEDEQISLLKYIGLVGNQKIVAATMNLSSPIVLDNISVVCYSGDIQEIVENGRLVGISYVDGEQTHEVRAGNNQMFLKVGQEYRLIDYSDVINQFARENISRISGDFSHTGSLSLEGEDLDFFNICMPLAAAAGKIDAGTKLSFVAVQGSSSTNSEFGTTYNITIKAVDLQNNQLYNLGFVFDDASTSIQTSTIDLIKDAINREQFRTTGGLAEEIMPESDIVLEYSSDITEYSIPAQEKENAN